MTSSRSEQIYTVQLTARELSATIEAFNVADGVVAGRPPLKSGPVLKYAPPGGAFKRVNGPGADAWRKFVAAEGGRLAS